MIEKQKRFDYFDEFYLFVIQNIKEFQLKMGGDDCQS
jgi:hypothetical protein